MTDDVPPEPRPQPTPDPHPDWRPLPPRARSLFALSHGAIGLVFVIPLFVLSLVFGGRFAIAAAACALVVPLALGIVVGLKRWRSAAWRLDADGFAYRRGRFFFSETRVPASRVQHLDIKHGPLERHWKLATLVIHTAGSRMSAVSVPGLDVDDAERLRDRLALLIDADDAL